MHAHGKTTHCTGPPADARTDPTRAAAESLVLLRAEAGEAVRHVEPELVCALDDLLALLGADVVSDLDGVLLIVHQQHLQVRGALHQELIEAILETEPGLLVRTVADVGHDGRALELPPHAAIDAAGLAPRGVHPLEAVRLEAGEFLHAFLADLALVSRRRHPACCFSLFCSFPTAVL